jgi:hypothetical protein
MRYPPFAPTDRVFGHHPGSSGRGGVGYGRIRRRWRTSRKVVDRGAMTNRWTSSLRRLHGGDDNVDQRGRARGRGRRRLEGCPGRVYLSTWPGGRSASVVDPLTMASTMASMTPVWSLVGNRPTDRKSDAHHGERIEEMPREEAPDSLHGGAGAREGSQKRARESDEGRGRCDVA